MNFLKFLIVENLVIRKHININTIVNIQLSKICLNKQRIVFSNFGKIFLKLVFEKNKRTNGREKLMKMGLDSESVAQKIISIYNEVLA